MRMRLSVHNARGVVANLYAADKRIKGEVRRSVKMHGELTKELTQFLCAYDTGFMHDHVRTRYSRGGMAWQTGWDDADFAAADLPFYPPYVEFGTSKMAAQPALGPAYRDVDRMFRQDLREKIRGAIQRMSRTRGRGR